MHDKTRPEREPAPVLSKFESAFLFGLAAILKEMTQKIRQLNKQRILEGRKFEREMKPEVLSMGFPRESIPLRANPLFPLARRRKRYLILLESVRNAPKSLR
tara:strand:+ start:3201 stop:3506 length:306 start_codon:yes stop_codon:yes gene_type:complete